VFGGALFLGSPLGSSYRVEDGGTETLLVGKLQPAGVQLDSVQDTAASNGRADTLISYQ
jgi:hypothetical protein